MKWRASGTISAGTYLGEIEADSKEEAAEKALAAADINLCFQCSDVIIDPEGTDVTVELVDEGDQGGTGS